MRIVSYNINGLNAFYNKDGVGTALECLNPDILCFQETKMDNQRVTEYLKEFEDYHVFSNENTWKKGYAGVATLIKNSILDSILTVSTPQLAGEYSEGRIVTLEFKEYYLVNVYTLNSGEKDQERKDWDILFYKYIQNLQQFKSVVIVGDLNVVHTNLDYWGNYEWAIDTMPGLKQYEIEGFSKLLDELDLIDSFRTLHPDSRYYSWFSYRGGARAKNKGWRIDYALISSSLKSKLKNSVVLSTYEGSDHCPILIELDQTHGWK